MKYKLRHHGWEFSMSAHSLTDEELQTINTLIESGEYEDIQDMGFELEDILKDYYYYEANMFSANSKSTESAHFVLEDEEGNEILQFDLNDMGDLYEMLGDDYDKEEYRGFDAVLIPDEDHPHILKYLEENKGHMCNYYFESDEVPTAEDFSYISGCIETEDGDWDFVDKVLFKKQILEPNYDDSWTNGKNLEWEIISYEG